MTSANNRNCIAKHLNILAIVFIPYSAAIVHRKMVKGIHFPIEETVITSTGDNTVIVYDIAKPEDAEELNEFFHVHFFPAQPIRQLRFWDESEENKKSLQLEDSMRKRLQANPGISIVAREKMTGHLIGCKINEIEKRDTFVPQVKPPADVRTPGWLIRTILAALNEDVNLFDLCNTDKIVNFLLGAMRPDYSNLGIHKRMHELSAEIAQSVSAGAIRMEAFSHFAGTSKLNQLVKSIDYATFQLDDGSRPLANVDLGVHKSARLLVRLLNNNQNNL